MLIDWFTVGAQALNFIVLVWLLKRLLYKPVLDAIDAREQRIAARIADAETREKKAITEGETFRQKSEAFDFERAEMLQLATRQASAERERLIEVARRAADALSAGRQQALRSEAAQLHQTLAEQTQREVFAIARRTLSDLASSSLEEQIAEMFARRLRVLDEAGVAALAGDLGPQTAVVVRSAFDLAAGQRTAIEAALSERIGNARTTPLHFEFVTAPELVCGIELVAGGHKIAWSIDQYLESLDRAVNDLLCADEQPAPAVRESPGEPEPRQ